MSLLFGGWFWFFFTARLKRCLRVLKRPFHYRSQWHTFIKYIGHLPKYSFQSCNAVRNTLRKGKFMIKLISLLIRPSEMTKAEFLHKWRVEHAEMALTVPGLRKFVLNIILKEPSRPDVPDHPFTCDGIAELWFDDEAQMKAVLATEALQIWRAHGASFIGSIKAFLVEEQIVIAGE
jgi:uncharacterized protein (TIGR02118 family)